MAPAVNEILDNNNILFISPTMSYSCFNGIDDDFIRVNPSLNEQADGLVELVTNQYDIKRMTVFYSTINRLYTEPIYKRFKEEFENRGGKIVYVNSFDSSSLENLEFINEIIENESEGLMIAGSSVDTASIMQQLSKNDINLPTFIPQWALTNDLIYHGGKVVEGVYGVGYFDLDNNSKKYIDFVDNYYNHFSEYPTYSSIMAYESVMVLKRGNRKIKFI